MLEGAIVGAAAAAAAAARPAGWGTMAVVGATYLERGRPVTVLVQWRCGPRSGPTGPRNVLIRRADGSLVVRPFRGLRRADTVAPPPH